MKKHEIKLDVTPAVEAADRIRETVGEAFDKGLGAFRDFTQRPVAASKWVSKENPYRQALLEIIEALEVQERTAEDDAKKLGPYDTKPPARIHQEGRAHAFRDARSLVQLHWPPEPAGKIKPGE